ncbi:MAG: ABC transporter permease [Polaromonas sp.]
MNTLVNLVLRRGALGIATLAAAAVLIFVGTELLPGDVAQAILGQSATPEALAVLRRDLGLDQPGHVRFGKWVWGILHGDLGRSLANQIAVSELIADRLANTMILAAAAALVAVPLSLILGLVSALYHDRLVDRAASGVSLLFVSFPEFLIGYLMMFVFAIKLGWLPPLSMISEGATTVEWLQVLALPVATLTAVTTAHTMRLARTAIVSVLSADYIQMAELKGLAPFRITLRHAVPNAMSPILSIVMLTLAYLVVGVVVVEAVFNFPGMGKLMVDAVAFRDLPLVQACGLVFCAVFVVLNFLADFLSIVTNPRLRHPRS